MCADKVTSFVIIVSLDMLSLCFRQNKSVIILKSDIHLNIEVAIRFDFLDLQKLSALKDSIYLTSKCAWSSI